ncbi:hypothetical protein [Microbacterium sp. T2.11-28]|uniref:hypothetical protein n=1 Tax=Microbacterium sp. T2.11-28 TaxID=3041169 RepID=UPI002477635E|nr:hypothetical protein [Microbacterium sp. T2.11-28]CAI9394035.1 hypothetical protein MICABA_02653 [Microbacterium sp. T2.11-28]
MSNRRRPSAVPLYHAIYLHSRAWYARRARWFDHAVTLGSLTCAGCGRNASRAELELHHLDYRGMSSTGGIMHAFELHEDLLPLHPYCHDLLHRLIDRDQLLSRNRTRRDATHIALSRLRPKLQESA